MSYVKLKEKINRHPKGSTMTFWLVRHGDSEATAMGDKAPIDHDLPLTHTGLEEADRIRNYFVEKHIPVTDVYASSKVRAAKTAEPTARVYGLTTKLRDALGERRWGSLRTSTWPEVDSILSKLTIEERYHFKPDGGESWQEMEERVLSVLDEIADDHLVGDNVVIVTHGGVLRALLPLLAQVSKERHAEYSVDTGAIAKFSFNNDSFDFVNVKP